MTRPWYQRGYRRILVDMHIPDWDPRLLAKYDPAEMVRLYERAGVTSVMFYCQSHVGLCYWPTRTGRQHASLRGRDIVGEMLALLKAKGLDACGYYSVVFNNWACLHAGHGVGATGRDF
jgi:alpha-L-fucosidase